MRVSTNTGGLLTVEGTLNLATTTIIGGTITGSGGSDLIDVTGDSKIDGSAALNTANVTVDATKTLTLDDVTATTDAFTDTGTIQVEGTHTLTLKAVAKITNGAITNLGTIDVFAAGATTITNDVFTNTGGLLTVEGTLNLATTTISAAPSPAAAAATSSMSPATARSMAGLRSTPPTSPSTPPRRSRSMTSPPPPTPSPTPARFSRSRAPTR